MKKSRILILCGTAILAVSAVFASKANKKFAAFNTAVGSGTGNNTSYVIISSDLFTSAAGGNLLQPLARLVTATSKSTIAELGPLVENAVMTPPAASFPSTDW